jgi:DNA-binding response OmpR family regulator
MASDVPSENADMRAFVSGERISMRKRTILLVDDDPDICGFVTAALEEEGNTVVRALGSTALKVAQETHPDVILLDLSMPILDGTALSRLLRASRQTADVPIVAMTATPRRNVPTDFRFDAWLGKPFDLVNLFIVVDAVTRKSDSAPVS